MFHKNKTQETTENDDSKYIGLPEDSRISATLRRMLREEDESKFLSLCNHLQDSLALSDNAAYIRRSLDMILDSLMELIRGGLSQTVRFNAAKCLGHVGHNLEKDLKRYLDWIFSKYHAESEDEVRSLLMKGLREDTVDIIVGWHIDYNQPASVIKFASKTLKHLAPFWLRDIGFTISLLTQFVEDAENCLNDISDVSLNTENSLNKLTSFVNYVLYDMESALKAINPQAEDLVANREEGYCKRAYKISDAENVILFNFRALADRVMGAWFSGVDRFVKEEVFDVSLPMFEAFSRCLNWLSNIVVRCWSVLETEHGTKALNNAVALTNWAVLHSAHLCVGLKLRTPLGKPLDTFMTLEGAIRRLAKETLTHLTVTNSDSSPFTMERARLLVQFMDHLEKAIYNAAEGTSSALPAVHKSPDFESTLLHIGWGLASIGEPEAIQGLYVWARDTIGIKHPALKPLVDQAAGRFELAAEGYRTLIKNDLSCSPVHEKKSSETDTKNSQAPHSVKTFIADQLTECYLAMNNWEDLELWKEKEGEFLSNENGSSAPKFIIQNEFISKKKELKSPIMEQVLWWSLALNGMQQRCKHSSNIRQYTLQVARAARKEGNYNVALKVLVKHLAILGLISSRFSGNICELSTQLMSDGTTDWSYEKAAALTEVSKQLYSLKQQEKGVDVCIGTIHGLKHCVKVESKEKISNLLLNLASWLQTPEMSKYNISQLKQVLELEGSLMIPDSMADINTCPILEDSILGERDCIIGKLLRQSVIQCPGLKKAWGRLGAWAYTWGHKAVDSSNNSDIVLNIPDEFIPPGTEKELVQRLLSGARLQVDDIEQVENINNSEALKMQLLSIGKFTSEQLDGLIDLWANSFVKVYNYYTLSAYAYFKYLQICDEQEGCDRITATLRLLRLILKYAPELQSVLEAGLASTPTGPWVTIVPQLFSRLNHPEPYVRKRISELLTRIGCDAPHLITFPAVVGSHAGASTIKDMPQTKLFSTRREIVYEIDDEDEPEEDDEDEEIDVDEDDGDDDTGSVSEETAVLENSFLSIVDALEKQVRG
ncbi:hypothetical protein AAG570_013601 [Ranatra chinensis]|uniref:FAT domain-containing protein n=1 Tax=Ranatra chinensis TaxID=642074 RepID=A0ABD0YDC5_9HEMI